MSIPLKVQQKVSEIENLATLPIIAVNILEKVRSSQSTMKEISGSIERDASIAAKILRVSNSPMWGYPGKIDNIQRALVILGLKQVTNIVIAVSLYSTFIRLQANPNFNRERFWIHSAATGQLSRTLSKKLNFNFHGEDFVAALIHDVGKFIFDQFFNEEFRNILEKPRQNGKDIAALEQEAFGCDHAQIGGWLLDRWHLPKAISTAVEFHHSPEKAVSHRELTAVIHLADVLCEMWGVGFEQDQQKFCFEEDPAWTILQEKFPHLKELDMEKITFELQTEAEAARLFVQLIQD